MKRHFTALLAILVLATLSWAQAAKSPFDANKSRQELEIMKGILSTKLSFALQNSQKNALSSWRFSNINAFYLAGQGAVFVVPQSSLGISYLPGVTAINITPEYTLQLAKVRDEIEATREELEANREKLAREAAFAAQVLASKLQQQYLRGQVGGTGQGTGQGTGDSKPPAPPAPPSPAAPPAPPPPPPKPVVRESLLKQVEELKAKTKQTREQAEANRAKFLKDLVEIQGQLIDALANYGDSMTTVKSDEHINLVLLIDSFYGEGDTGSAIQRTQHEVISVQKSWITDYKAGRLSLDAFKQKVLQYTE
jgi:flagellar biosynthesis/type III secretory pathway protein FliH